MGCAGHFGSPEGGDRLGLRVRSSSCRSTGLQECNMSPRNSMYCPLRPPPIELLDGRWPFRPPPGSSIDGKWPLAIEISLLTPSLRPL